MTPLALIAVLAAPAVAQEYLTVADGHLAWQSGERARFWGVNLVDELGREKAEIDQIAARVPQMGFNACRLHLYDVRLLDSDAVSAGGKSTSRVPRACAKGDDSPLDRFDYAIAKLEEQGLRLFLTFDRARWTFQPGDSDDEAWSTAIEEFPQWSREQLPYIDDTCAELQLEYTRTQLDHVNAYTGRRIAEDPNIILYELTNENGFVKAMLEGAHRKWPEYFQAVLRAKWNAWLREEYPTMAALREAWSEVGEGESPAGDTVAFEPAYGNAAEYPSGRLADVHRFTYHCFQSFNERQVALMRSMAAQGVGSSVVPICFDTVHEHKIAWMAAASRGDFLCVGTYTNEATHNQEAPRYPFASALDGRPQFYNLSYQGAIDKPTVIYETNVLKPAPHRASYPFRVAALGSWQDWDAVFWYVWSDGTVKDQVDPQVYIDAGLRYAASSHIWHGIVIATDEVLLAALNAAGKIFTGFHLQPAPDPLVVEIGTENLLHTNWIGDIDVPTPPGAEGKYPKAEAENATTFTRGLKWDFRFDQVETRSPDPLVAKLNSPLVQNGETTYDWERGTLVIDAPGAKAVIGFPGSEQTFSGGVSLTLPPPVGGVSTPTVSSADPSATASQALVGAASAATSVPSPSADFVTFALVAEPGQSLASTDSATAILIGTGENDGFTVKDEWDTDPSLTFHNMLKTGGSGPPRIRRHAGTITLPKAFATQAFDFLMQPIGTSSGIELTLTSDMAAFVITLRAE